MVSHHNVLLAYVSRHHIWQIYAHQNLDQCDLHFKMQVFFLTFHIFMNYIRSNMQSKAKLLHIFT